MVFSSFQFLFLFLPIVLLVNRFLPLKVSNVFLLVTSLLFYYIGEGYLVLILVGSILWNYVAGILLGATSNLWKKITATLCILGNLAILFYYKYVGYFVTLFSLENVFKETDYSSIVLPIGISFFTFQGISYIIDVYRGTNEVEVNPIKLGLFISFFPQLIAGPIVKYNELVYDLSHRVITTDKIVTGSQKFIRGLFKKVVLANNIAMIADIVFSSEIASIPTGVAWLGVLAYTLQIYYDFSGYSDMAIGLCLVFGFEIPENFEHPYISRSFREFWRRWHISLSTWFKNYLYIPLGGNRNGKIRMYIALVVVFFLTGLWHGASSNFVIWGMLHGCFLLLERLFSWDINKKYNFLKHVYVVLGVSLAWVFFRIQDFESAILFIQKLFVFEKNGDFTSLLRINNYYIFLFLAAILFTTPLRKYILEKTGFNKERNGVQKLIFNNSIYIALFFYCIVELSLSTYTPFIYFKF